MKKFLKIIISLLLLLLISLVVISLVVKEVNYKVKTTVNLPLKESFALFSNQTKSKEWLTSIKSITPIKETENKVGSQYKIIIDNHGKDFEMIENVTHFEPNKIVGLAFEVPSMKKNDIYTFSSNGNQTIITNNVSCKGQTFITRATFPLLKSVFARENQLYLDNFKNFAEKK